MQVPVRSELSHKIGIKPQMQVPAEIGIKPQKTEFSHTFADKLVNKLTFFAEITTMANTRLMFIFMKHMIILSFRF